MKQVEHVCDLIKELNEAKVRITFSIKSNLGGHGGSSLGIFFNIFEIGAYDNIDPEGLNIEYEEAQVLFDRHSNQLFKLEKYINHPLTPKFIADELLNFYNRNANYIDDTIIAPGSKFITLHTGIWEEKVIFDTTQTSLVEGRAIAYSTWLNLKTYSQNLKEKIGRFLIENGIQDNNIREDFKKSGY